MVAKRPHRPETFLGDRLTQEFTTEAWTEAVDSLKPWVKRAGVNPDDIDLDQMLTYYLDANPGITELNERTGRAIAGRDLPQFEQLAQDMADG